MWVFDATPLIYLAKVDCLDHIATFEAPTVIPERVVTEVVEAGLEEGYPDARRIDRAVEDGVFEVRDVDPTPLAARLQENPNLSAADVAVLVAAEAHDGIAVIDETYGRDVAAAEGIPTRGTAYLVLRLAEHGTLTADEARDIIDAMVDAGWYCAPDIYAKIVQSLDELTD